VGLHWTRWLTIGDQVYPCRGDAVLSYKDPSAAHSAGGFYNRVVVEVAIVVVVEVAMIAAAKADTETIIEIVEALAWTDTAHILIG
ncbi:hypothetical protein GIB67_013814, partial [Kingdonia uniflora]